MLNWKSPGGHCLVMQEVLNLIFLKHPQLLHFLFDRHEPCLRQDAETLLYDAGVFSSGEKILVQVALDLWCGQGEARLWDIVERLDSGNYHNLLAGLRHLRPTEMGGEPEGWRQLKMACSMREPGSISIPGST
jgi:hypothetical protein